MAGFDFGAVTVVDDEPISTARNNPADNPAIPHVQASWDAAEQDAKGIWRGKTLGFDTTEKEASKAVAQLRAAAGFLGIGLSVQLREVKDAKGKVLANMTHVTFQAKTKRGERDNGSEEASE